MTWKQDKLDEMAERSAYVIELESKDPAGLDELLEDRGVSMMISSWEDRTTLLVEAGVDMKGEGFVIASAVDRDGEPVRLSVFAPNDTSALIHAAGDVDTSVREE